MKIAAYCRVSTGKDEQLDSLEHQKQFFSAYAEQNGHVLVGLYADEGITGTSLRRREEFLRLMRDARLGLFEAVVVKDISRFARNTVDFLQSIRELKALGVNTMFITSNMESLGESEFVLTIFGALAQEESANLSRRVKFGKRLNAEKGRVPQCIFGYDRMDNFTLAINPTEAQTVREIYRLYLDGGLGCRTISLELNRQGRKTKYGCEWNPRAVRRVLTNSIYCGHYVNHRYEIEDYLTGRQIQIPPEEQFHHERPEWAIIPPDVFSRVQAQLRERSTHYGGSAHPDSRYSAKHLLSTLIRCAHCGRAFCRKQYTYANTRVYWKCATNDRYTAERCSNTIKLDEADLLGQISVYFSSLIGDKEQFLAGILSDAERQVLRPQNDGEQARAERRRRELRARRERYQEMYAGGVMTMDELKAKTRSVLEELRALDPKLNRQPAPSQSTSTRWYRDEIEHLLRLEHMTNPDLRRLIDHISVSRDGEVRVVLKQLEEAP